MELYKLTVHELSKLLKSRNFCPDIESIFNRIKELDGLFTHNFEKNTPERAIRLTNR